jgi:hypothetical protein
MSWDIVIFNSKQRINSPEEVQEDLLVPLDFSSILENHFNNIFVDGEHREITGDDFSICYFVGKEPVSNKIFNLYGENGLFELIRISKIYNWQIFDTGSGQMIDLEDPAKNGYANFKKYLQHVLFNKG